MITVSTQRPILFSAPMIRALLDGRKTQTRRIVKPQLERAPVDVVNGVPSWDAPTNYGGEVQMNTMRGKPCPYGKPGDLLWVRETWAQPTTLDPGPTFYFADYPACVPSQFENVPPASAIKWRPSIHMRRELSRITLRITDVRVERLQDISDDDAMAEGVERLTNDFAGCFSCGPAVAGTTAVECYSRLWESINGAGSWEANPWVWAISFEVVNQSTDVSPALGRGR